MIVWPGLRRSVSAISRLFNSASFVAPLTYSAVPQRAAPGTTGSFTRATTKTVENNDGYLVTLLSGEIGFPGARRVRNLVSTTSAVFTNAAWVKTNCTVTGGQSDPDGGANAYEVNFTGVGNGQLQNSTAFTSLTASDSGRDFVWSCYMKAGTKTDVGARVFPGGGGTGQTTSVTIPATWTRMSGVCTISGTPAGTLTFDFLNVLAGGAPSSAAGTFYIYKFQLEDVTAQTTQTAGEYVSVGVPSDWKGTELVTNGTFDTATTGWTAGEVLGGAAGTLSVVGGRMRITNTGTSYGAASQSFTTVVGAKYILTSDFVLGSAPSGHIRIGSTGFASFDLGLLSLSANGRFSAEFTATTTTTTLTVYNLNNAGAYNDFDNISVKVAYYHGSMVDGVKCFATDINGSPIPSTTLLGYQAEGARTNLCLQSNAFTTTWTNTLTSSTQNVVGPDGGTTAWTLVDNSAISGLPLSQAITLTAAAWTASIFVKKTTGAQASYPIIEWVPATGTVEMAAVTIDTSNGVATLWTAYTGYTMASGMSASCVSYNDNYWRVSLTKTGTAAAHTLYIFVAGTTNATQSTGTEAPSVTGSAVFYGAQVELGSFASSYIPTTTIAVARNADVLTYTGGDIPNLKTLMAGFRREVGVGSSGAIAQLDDGTANDFVITYLSSATAIRHQGTDGGAVQWNLPVVAVSTYVPGTACKSVQTWTTNDVKAAVNGATLTGDTAATVPTVTQLTVGHLLGALQLDGNVGPIYGWTRNQSQSELNAVTQ